MIAATRRTIIHRISGNAFVDFVRESKVLHVRRSGIAPWARIKSPDGARTSAVISRRSVRAHIQLPAVISLPKAIPDRIDTGKETVAAYAHLPLDRAGRTARKSHRARTVILRAAVGHRRGRSRKVRADVARIKFDRVQPVVHVEPLSMGRSVAA